MKGNKRKGRFMLRCANSWNWLTANKRRFRRR